MNPEELAQRLQAYRQALPPAAGQTTRELAFFALVKDLLGINLASFRLEEPVYQGRVFRGRVDALLGSLVFEFKSDFERELESAREQLARYITDLRSLHPGTTYTAVATDGLRFQVFRPVYGDDGVTVQELASIGELDLGREQDPQGALLWLDGLLREFREARAEPTTQSIVAGLGPGSLAYRTARLELEALYRRVRADPGTETKFRLWRRYLSIVYGEAPGDEAALDHLFLKHTYLASIAKLIALFRLRPSPLASLQELEEAFKGDLFLKQGIVNYVEEDFFTWFLGAREQGTGNRSQESGVREEALLLMRRLLLALDRFDFTRVKEDTLKGLYQGLVDPEARHDLGEYYTPDWLAEYILAQELRLPEDPQRSILDPACGSGTFLFVAIRLVKEALKARGMDRPDILFHILNNVVGMDVHPLAVTIARTNYLLALGDLLEGPHPEISVPVYLADSLKLPDVPKGESKTVAPGQQLAMAGGHPEKVYTVRIPEEDVAFELPESVVSNPSALAVVVHRVPQYLAALEQDPTRLDAIVAAFRTYLRSPKGRTAAPEPLSPFASDVLCGTFIKLAQLYLEGRDSVWPFVLKNNPMPVFLSERRFDLVAGNPPWLSLRYVRSPAYAAWVREQVLKEYQLLEKGKPHLFTQMELATLFFARAADLYLREGGTIAFVMPRGALGGAQQHARFTGFSFKGGALKLRLERVLDLYGVAPLFNVPACVLAARKGSETAFPVPCTQFSGELPSRNASWGEAQERLARREVHLARVGGRLLPQDEAERLQAALGRSYYADRFYQGATIVPRNLWFVQVPRTPLGFNPEHPPLETDEGAARTAKAPWRDLRMRGNVEARFLYATLVSGDLLPFGYRRLSLVVLPVASAGGRYELVNSQRALEQGHMGLLEWLRQAQGHWERLARRDEGGNLKIGSFLERLDYRRGLTRQSPALRYKVLYNKSGTNLVSGIVDQQMIGPMLSGMTPVGFAADHECYIYETDSEQEAHFLTSMLNAQTVDQLIKPTQTRGQWGERDIHKRVWQLAIPRFDPADAAHRRLAELGQACHARVREAAPEVAKRYRSTARARAAVRELLRAELEEIDGLVKKLLGI